MKKIVFSLLYLFAVAIGANGAVIVVNESFQNYSIGALTTSTAMSATGLGTGNFGIVGANTYTVTSGTMSYTNGTLSIDGGSQYVSMAGTAANSSLNMALASNISGATIGASSSFYVSYLHRFNGTASSGNLSYNAFLTAAQATAGSIGSSSLYSGTSAANFVAGIGTRAATGTSPSVTSSVNFIVAKFTTSATSQVATVNVWVNPTSSVEGASTLSNATAATNTNIFTTLGLLGGALDAGESVDFDRLMVGNDWADVVAVPEPSSFALMAVGGLGLMVVRRRKAAKA